MDHGCPKSQLFKLPVEPTPRAAETVAGIAAWALLQRRCRAIWPSSCSAIATSTLRFKQHCSETKSCAEWRHQKILEAWKPKFNVPSEWQFFISHFWFLRWYPSKHLEQFGMPSLEQFGPSVPMPWLGAKYGLQSTALQHGTSTFESLTKARLHCHSCIVCSCLAQYVILFTVCICHSHHYPQDAALFIHEFESMHSRIVDIVVIHS